jgi:hypothetical protein
MQDYSVAAQRRWRQQRQQDQRAARIARAKPSWDAWRAEELVKAVAFGGTPPTKEQISEFARLRPQGEPK